MAGKKGFTLIEIIVVLIIIAILAIIALPNYITMIERGYNRNSITNLNAIVMAEQAYYFSKGHYCIWQDIAPPNNPDSTCGEGLANLDAALNLNIVDPNFGYYCDIWPAGELACYTERNNKINTQTDIVFVKNPPYCVDYINGCPGYCPTDITCN